jgi:hypothetical protein
MTTWTFYRDDKQIGTIEAEVLALDTQDRELLTAFEEAQREGVDVWIGESGPDGISDGAEVRKLVVGDPEVFHAWREELAMEHDIETALASHN